MPPEGPTRPATEHPGQPSWIAPVKPVVPDHELLKRVGGGSYGDVWLARSVVGTWRAVKVVFRDRFLDARPYEREFNGMQKFEPLSRSNEGFVDILQIGRNDAEGYFYYVMELADDAAAVPGGTSSASPNPPPRSDPELSGTRVTRPSEAGANAINPETYVPKTLSKALLQRGRLPVSECLELGITLNLALARLHSAGLIHRDIKPSNLIFVGGVPKLADIGLVIEYAEARSYVGTEGFIPPEGPNSPQADLYSLGKVLYEAGMGKDRKEFPEPLTRLVEAPDAPELLEFNAILLKACAANVKDRYRSAEEMNADLALLQSGGSVRRQRKLAGQLRFVQRAGALVTALAAVIAAGWLWQARQTHIVRQLADEKTRLAEENKQRALAQTRLASEKASLVEESRQRLVRLDVANGVRIMDDGDLQNALPWFAEALPLVTNNATEEATHRIRIQCVLDQMPRLLDVTSEGENVPASGFSPDGKLVVVGTLRGRVRIYDSSSRQIVCQPPTLPGLISQARFTRDGRRLLLSSSPTQGNVRQGAEHYHPAFVAVLDARTGEEVFPAVESLPGMSSNLVYSAFSPDDRWLGAALSSHVIRVLDARDGHRVAELEGHTDEIRMVAFSPDGSLLASASKDRTVRIWQIPSGQPLGPPMSHDGPLRRVAFSPDGLRLATATDSPAYDDETSSDTNCIVQTWDAHTGRIIGPKIRVPIMSFMLAFDEPGGKSLITGGYRSSLSVWDADTHGERFPPVLMTSETRCWAFSPDGHALAAGDEDYDAHIWDLETGELLFGPFRHAAWVESVHFSPDGSRLLTTSDDGTARLWKLARAFRPLSLRFDAEVSESSSPDESWGRRPGPLVIGLKDRSFRLVDSENLKEVHRLDPSRTDAPPYVCVAGPQGRSWAVFSGQDEALDTQLVDIFREHLDGLLHCSLPRGKLTCSPIFSPDESRFLTCCADRKIRSWRTSDGTLDETFSLPQGGLQVVEFLSDAKRALINCEDGNLELMEIASQRSLSILSHLPFPYSRYAINPEGSRFAGIGGQSGFVFDLTTGRLLTPPFKQGGSLYTLDLSADGTRLVTAGAEGRVNIWDTSTGALLQQLMDLKRTIQMKGGIPLACWSADGRFVVASDEDRNARVWDAATGEPVTPLLRHEGRVLSAAITYRDRLLTLSKPNLLQAWDFTQTHLTPDVIADFAKLISGRRLSGGGVLLKLRPEELAELCRSLRNRAPQLFE